MSEREFDIIIFGATGYTGRLVAEYFLKTCGLDRSVKWAIAGRSQAKMRALREQLPNAQALELIIADASEPLTLKAMAARTKVVISTAGPYQLYGSELVSACAEQGTDYVDLAGEPNWIAAMIQAHEATAKRSGARLVFSCGFDSIPFDLGVWFAQQEAHKRFGHYAERVRGRVRKMQGVLSGGTFASGDAVAAAAEKDPAVNALMADPFAYTFGFKGPAQPDAVTAYEDELTGTWVGPFIMADINPKAVHRTNQLLGHPWQTSFQYDEMLMLAGPPVNDDKPTLAGFDFNEGGHPAPGQGPSQQELEAGFYDVLFIAQEGDGRTVRVSVSSNDDPGYLSTSKMLAESALTLAFDTPRSSTPGGCWTPAAAMNTALIKRLAQKAGLMFTVES
ncbi:saccharopine dehydrogenase family protein [Pseudomonas farris]